MRQPFKSIWPVCLNQYLSACVCVCLRHSCCTNKQRERSCSCVCVWTYVTCLCACTHARTNQSSSFPRRTIRPSGGERDWEWVSHPADERVKSKGCAVPKNITQLPCSLFEVIWEEGGKRHTFSIALKHGVRQLPSCIMLWITFWFEVEF